MYKYIDDLDKCFEYVQLNKNDKSKLMKLNDDILEYLQEQIWKSGTGGLKEYKKKYRYYKHLHTEINMRIEAADLKKKRKDLMLSTLKSVMAGIAIVFVSTYTISILQRDTPLDSLKTINSDYQDNIERLNETVDSLKKQIESVKSNDTIVSKETDITIDNSSIMKKTLPFISIGTESDISALRFDYYSIKKRLDTVHEENSEFEKLIIDLKRELNDIKNESDLSKYLNTVESIESYIKVLDTKYTYIESIIMDDPVKVLSIPMMKKEIEFNNTYIDLLEKEIAEFREWIRWLITISISILGIVIGAFTVVKVQKGLEDEKKVDESSSDFIKESDIKLSQESQPLEEEVQEEEKEPVIEL